MTKLDEHPYTWTEGDTLPSLACQLSDTNLAGYTITLRILRPDGSVLERTAVGSDFATGGFRFDFITTDLQAGYAQRCEIEFDDGVGGIETTPAFAINVKAELG